MFAGRTDVLGTMIGAIEDQRLHLVIYGERGIGKTSLLHMLAGAARDARYIVVYSSCGAGSNFQETFRAAAAEIPLLFHSGFGPTAEEAEAGATLEALLPPDFSPRQFADLCVKVTGTRALFILDEFDRSGSVEFRRDLAELIKFLSDRSVRVQVVIAGVAADLAELVEHIPSIRRNILAVRVPRMSDDEIRQIVSTGEQASGLTFDVAAREFIVTLSRGWPYIASLLCHHSGLRGIDAGRTTVMSSNVSAAVDDCVVELRARMAKGVRLQVDRLRNEGAGKLLTLLAGASLAAGGDFDVSDIDELAQKNRRCGRRQAAGRAAGGREHAPRDARRRLRQPLRLRRGEPAVLSLVPGRAAAVPGRRSEGPAGRQQRLTPLKTEMERARSTPAAGSFHMRGGSYEWRLSPANAP